MDPDIYRQMAINIQGMYHNGDPYVDNLGEYIKGALSNANGEYLTPAAQQFYETYIVSNRSVMNKTIGRIIDCFKSFVYAESAFGNAEYIAATRSKEGFNQSTTGMLSFENAADAYMISMWVDDTLGLKLGTALYNGDFYIKGDLLSKLIYQPIIERRCSYYRGDLLVNYLAGRGNSWGLNRSSWESPKDDGKHRFVAAVGGGTPTARPRSQVKKGTSAAAPGGSQTVASSEAKTEAKADASWVRPGLKKMYTYRTSPDVQDIQHIMNVAAGTKLQEDGAFGPVTIDAVYRKLSKDTPSIDRQINNAFNNGVGGGILTMTSAK